MLTDLALNSISIMYLLDLLYLSKITIVIKIIIRIIHVIHSYRVIVEKWRFINAINTWGTEVNKYIFVENLYLLQNKKNISHTKNTFPYINKFIVKLPPRAICVIGVYTLYVTNTTYNMLHTALLLWILLFIWFYCSLILGSFHISYGSIMWT